MQNGARRVLNTNQQTVSQQIANQQTVSQQLANQRMRSPHAGSALQNQLNRVNQQQTMGQQQQTPHTAIRPQQQQNSTGMWCVEIIKFKCQGF